MEGYWNPAEEAALAQRTQYTLVGSAETVRRRLEQVIAETAADEIIAVAQIYDHAARLRSYEIGASVFQQLATA
jgi:alkanesulfonate monooxygenase SsuD/methylene tetrahydromethanopterin reductase-like flavin-dependent oxidoreductase (luciferase family)